MSKESYMAGFCKKAAAHNIDPQKLAQFVAQQLDKQAAAGDVWGKVMQVIETAKQNAVNAWNRIDPELRPLAGGAIGAGVGAGGGALLGKLLGIGAGKGALAGLGIGGISGSALGAKSWNDFTTNAHKKEINTLNGRHKQQIDAITAARADDARAHSDRLAKIRGEHADELSALTKARADDAKAYTSRVAELEAKIKALNVMRGKRTSNNNELADALQELEAQKKQIQNQAARNFAEQFMEKWKATQVSPEAKK